MPEKKPIVGRVNPSKTVPPLPKQVGRPGGQPRWLLSRLDLDGHQDGSFGWHDLDAASLRGLLAKLQSAERCTWQDLERQGSHFLTYEKLAKQARDRIAERKIAETDCIYSLRCTGEYRVIGLRFGDDFYLIWHDPGHRFCPSKKRGT